MAAAGISEILFHNFQIVEILYIDSLLTFIILRGLSTGTNASDGVGISTTRLACRKRLALV
jgi:hypothetical protein